MKIPDTEWVFDRFNFDNKSVAESSLSKALEGSPMSEDPIHDVPVGLQPVLQDLSETPRVDPLKRLIERYPPKPPPPRTKGKIDAKALISQLPAETLLWLQGPHREVNFRAPPPTPQLIAGLQKTLSCPLCHELFDDACTLPCGHTFCHGCVHGHFDTVGHACPRCKVPWRRQDITPAATTRGLVRIFARRDEYPS